LSGVQTLLTAASALEQQQEHQFSSNNLWSSTVSPWNDPHQNINSNQYSESLLSSLSSSLSQLKQEAVVYTTREFQQIGPHPLCLVREVYPARKGVVSEANIPEDEMIMEYKGFITTRQDVMVELNITSIKLLWQSKPSPFIYQYDKMSNLNICIDARHYGNFARFIRRSCSPNAELRHFFVENEVHFGIYAIHHISPGEEVTIGFDFPHDKCHYPVECACGHKTTCLLNGPRGYVALRGKRPHREVCGSESEIFQEDRHPNHR
jgi:histone-lysine N-methyltransferase MLL5